MHYTPKKTPNNPACQSARNCTGKEGARPAARVPVMVLVPLLLCPRSALQPLCPQGPQAAITPQNQDPGRWCSPNAAVTAPKVVGVAGISCPLTAHASSCSWRLGTQGAEGTKQPLGWRWAQAGPKETPKAPPGLRGLSSAPPSHPS